MLNHCKVAQNQIKKLELFVLKVAVMILNAQKTEDISLEIIKP
jgi:hypothetical protein